MKHNNNKMKKNRWFLNAVMMAKIYKINYNRNDQQENKVIHEAIVSLYMKIKEYSDSDFDEQQR